MKAEVFEIIEGLIELVNDTYNEGSIVDWTLDEQREYIDALKFLEEHYKNEKRS